MNTLKTRFLYYRSIYFKRYYPFEAILELTTQCNSRCVYCGRTYSQNINCQHIDLGVLEKIVAFLHKRKGVQRVFVGGWGEPLLHPDFNVIAEILRQEFPMTLLKVVTNGISLTEDKYNALSNFDEVLISLNSANAETYRKINGVDKYDMVVENIQRFLRHKKGDSPVVLVQLLEEYSNKQERVDFYAKWLPCLNRNDRVMMQPIHNMGGLVSLGVKPTIFVPCFEAYYHMVFSLEGDIYPCCMTRLAGPESDIYLGNVSSPSLDWEKLATIREAQQDGKRSTLEPCVTCNVWCRNANHFAKVFGEWRLIK